MVYAVIDTNVLVSALLSRHPDSSTVVIQNYLLDGKVTPLYNAEILREYKEVLHRPKFKFPEALIDSVLDAIVARGMEMERIHSDEAFPDPKDIVFYEVALSKDDAFLVTGNTKHFPKTTIVVTPAEFLEIIGENAGKTKQEAE